MFELCIETDFSAAHRLRGYQGACERLHGHNYRVEIVLAGGKLDDLGMVMDFREAKSIIANVVERLDHQYLNEIEPFDKINPTTEHIAQHIAEALQRKLPHGVDIREVTCWESENSAVRYRMPRARGTEDSP